MEANVDPQRVESLGPAEKIVQTLVTFTDHMVHNRPGFVVADRRTNIGVRWAQAALDPKGTDPRKVYTVTKVGKRQTKTLVGVLSADGVTVTQNNRKVGEYRPAGLFPEVAAYLYKQVAEVYRMDADFAARWASWQFTQSSRDLKALLAAFMLVQEHSGQPVRGDDGTVLFAGDDFREVGEGMILKGKDFNPKILLRVGDILSLDVIAKINREMGFGHSARKPPMGRYNKTVTKWLFHREKNPQLLRGLVRNGFKSSVKDLARRVGYKPQGPLFFEVLGWKQKQAEDGRRQIALNLEIVQDTWADLDERQICLKITEEKPSFKVVVGKLPSEIGLTRAVMAACVGTKGVVSDKDMLILVPTLEELGLLEVPVVKDRLQKATQAAEDVRAANIARNVKSEAAREILTQAADTAVAKAMEEATRNLRVYVLIDKSGSMERALSEAVELLSKFLGGFPLDRTHVAVFDSMGREVVIKAPQRAAVQHAMSKFRAGGGTDHSEGLRALRDHPPAPDEDALILVIGDEGDWNSAVHFTRVCDATGIHPVAFGVLPVSDGHQGDYIKKVARALEVPCFNIDKSIFEDAYAVTSTLRNLIESTPTNKTAKAQGPRVSLVEQILQTELIQRPAWAA